MGFCILFPGGTVQGGPQNGQPHEYFKIKNTFTLHKFYIIGKIKRITDKLLIFLKS